MIPEQWITKKRADKLWKVSNKISDLIRKSEPVIISQDRILFTKKPSRKKLYKLFKKQHTLIKDLLNSL
jgi:hypothetical protein